MTNTAVITASCCENGRSLLEERDEQVSELFHHTQNKIKSPQNDHSSEKGLYKRVHIVPHHYFSRCSVFHKYAQAYDFWSTSFKRIPFGKDYTLLLRPNVASRR